MDKMPDETRQGFVAQGMWAEDGEAPLSIGETWFDIGGLLQDAPDAATELENALMVLETHTREGRTTRKLLATRIVRRTILDEPWPDRPPLPNAATEVLARQRQ